MFDTDAVFYIFSYATVTGAVLVVLVLGVIWASRWLPSHGGGGGPSGRSL